MLRKLFRISLINLFLLSCFNSITNTISEISVERGLYSITKPAIKIEKVTDSEGKRKSLMLW